MIAMLFLGVGASRNHSLQEAIRDKHHAPKK
jgi:hypothetical protein